MLENAHEGWKGRGRDETGHHPFDFRSLLRMVDEMSARPQTAEGSERLLEQVLTRIERRRHRRRLQRIAMLSAALVLAVWFSFRVLGSGAFAGTGF